MEELEAISVPGRKLCLLGHAGIQQLSQSTKTTLHYQQPWILIFHLQLPFLPKIKHPTATAPQNCQKIRSMWILFAINCCLWQREVPGCLVLPGEQIHYLPLHTVY